MARDSPAIGRADEFERRPDVGERTPAMEPGFVAFDTVPRIQQDMSSIAESRVRVGHMSLQETLRQELTSALRGGDTARRDALRLLISSVHNAEIEVGHALGDEEVLRVLQREAKERRESIEAFRKGGRQDLVDSEERELAIIEEFLPAQMSDDEALEVIRGVIAETGASTARDLGKVMGPLMQRLGGRYDGRRANELVREQLGSG